MSFERNGFSRMAGSLPLDPRDPKTANAIRQAILTHLHQAGGGHFGSCSSCVEILLALFASRTLACSCGTGDRLLLSKGHASMALYSILSLTGKHPLPLSRFGAFGSPLQGHPDSRYCDLVDFSFGSLGQGLAVGFGMAMGLQTEKRHVWVVLGDGECQEGMVWEAAMLAYRYHVNNLHVIIDTNGEQECGWAHDPNIDPTPVPNDLAKWRAFGWSVEETDGHNTELVAEWVQRQTNDPAHAPSALIARTRKSLTASAVLPRFRNHHTTLTDIEYRDILNALQAETGHSVHDDVEGDDETADS